MTDVSAAAGTTMTDTMGTDVTNENAKGKKPKPEEDSLFEWEDVVKGLGVIGLVAYIAGLVIVNAYLSRFGASDFDVVRPHSIATTILALVVIVVPLSLSLWATRWANAHTRNSEPSVTDTTVTDTTVTGGWRQSLRRREPLLAVLGALCSLVGLSWLVTTWPTVAAWETP